MTTKPPRAGPITQAICIRLVFQVTAMGKTSRGTSRGTRAVLAGRPRHVAVASSARSAYISRIGPSPQRERKESKRRQGRPQHAEDNNPATVESVREEACRQGEDDRRNGLRETDQPKGERLAGPLVDLPSDRDALNLVSHDREEPAQYVSPVVRDAECRVGIVLPGCGDRLFLPSRDGVPDLLNAFFQPVQALVCRLDVFPDLRNDRGLLVEFLGLYGFLFLDQNARQRRGEDTHQNHSGDHQKDREDSAGSGSGLWISA